MIDFSSWEEYEGASEGSGRSEKIWLVDPVSNMIGLFKYPKSLFTTEYFSEKLASELGQEISIDCAKVDIGEYRGRLGCLSYNIPNGNEILVEGIQLINKYYPQYDPDKMQDYTSKEYYSLDMILTALKEFDLQEEFLRVLVFDFLIGNTDRHQNNWGVIQKDKEFRLCPLYDNGSSLCCYVKETSVQGYLGKDLKRRESLVNWKSKSRIRIDGNQEGEPTHKSVMEHLKMNHYNEVVDLVHRIVSKVDENCIESLFEICDSSLISPDRLQLIKLFLKEKVRILSEMFED